MLLIVVRTPSKPDAVSIAASAAGLPLAEARLRLTGVLPRVLVADRDEGKLAAIGQALATAGFATAVVDPRAAPGDEDRIVARSLAFGSGELVVVEGVGVETRHTLSASAFELIQRGTRVTRSEKTTTTSHRKLDLGRAVMTGGLIMTKKVEKSSTQASEVREPFVVIHRTDGGRDVVLYEKRIDFRFLGPQMQPTSRGNLEATLVRLKALAPGVPFDERVAKPGFASGLPSAGADPVDLALHLVRIARRREAPSPYR
jgi:hypothetical protein